MKKNQLFTLIVLLMFTSCGSVNFTSFWIANNGDTPVELESTVISPTRLGGPEVLSKPLLAEPGDIIELGEAPFNENISITDLFNFKIAGNNETIKDPMDINNWQKIKDKEGNTKYVLYLISN